MSEFSVTVTSDMVEHIAPAVRLCFAHDVFSHREVTHYRQPHGGCMELLWSNDGALPLPYPMRADEAIDFLTGWLRRLPRGAWGEAPDCDGSLKQGWTISTKGMGFYGVVSMRTAWIIYGK